MERPAGDLADPKRPPEQTAPPDSVTRGFLFSDLRAYTDFVETHGAASAASLLDRYRTLVREAIGRFGGAEIKTEGDSFYVVFNSVSSAVRCALVITGNAIAEAAEHPREPIQVGVGVHAGETIETSEGYVGSPVNIAARICAQAGPNEVLVSETVRALTRSLLPVRFEPRGRRQLKGIAEPVPLFAVLETAPGSVPWAGPRRRHLPSRTQAIAGATITLLAAAVATALLFRSVVPGVPALPAGMWKIGLDMPLSGEAADRGTGLRNAVQLAIDDANRSGVLGAFKLELMAFDDAGATPGGQDPAKGATNAQAMVADPTTIAMVGPWSSSVAVEIIPVTNAAGLLECGPSNTDPHLTKPSAGALEIRPHPDRINYVRLAPADDIRIPALALFAYRDLNAKVALVVDDSGGGLELADNFQAAYTKIGGQAIRQTLEEGDDPMSVLAPLSQEANKPGVVLFAGFTNTGGAALRKAMVSSGNRTVPFLSWDGLLDGTGRVKGSFIQAVGATDAVGSYTAQTTLPSSSATFVDSYEQRYGAAPSNEYVAAAYACVEVIVDALRAIAKDRPTAEGLREALRAYAVDPGHRRDTVLSDVRFDANGDAIHQYVTFYRVDPLGAGGKGDWIPFTQHDYGPPPP